MPYRYTILQLSTPAPTQTSQTQNFHTHVVQQRCLKKQNARSAISATAELLVVYCNITVFSFYVLSRLSDLVSMLYGA